MSDPGPFRLVGTSEQLVDRVSDQIEKLIVDGQLEPNTILPSQSELTQMLGVSRTVVREAVRILSAKGLLESKRGVGTRVRQVTQQQIVEPLGLFLRTSRGGICFEDLHVVRTILEMEIAGLAAFNATEADVAMLRKIVTEMESAVENPTLFADKDAAFHGALAEATHNPLLVVISELRKATTKGIPLIGHPTPRPREQVLPYHYQILEHVATKDRDGACQAMREHLKIIRKNHQEVFGTPECIQPITSFAAPSRNTCPF